MNPVLLPKKSLLTERDGAGHVLSDNGWKEISRVQTMRSYALRLTPSLMNGLRSLANQRGVPLNRFIQQAVEEKLRRECRLMGEQ